MKKEKYIIRSYYIDKELYDKIKVYAVIKKTTISKIIEDNFKKIVKEG